MLKKGGFGQINRGKGKIVAMSWMQKFDDWMIDKVASPVAHKVEAETGVTNFGFANYVLVIWPATAGATALSKQSARWWVLAGLVLIVAAARYFWVVWLERKSQRSGMFANVERLTHRWWRNWQTFLVMFGVVSSTLLLSVSLSDLGTLAIWVHLYLSACNRPPPQEVKQPLFAQPATQGN